MNTCIIIGGGLGGLFAGALLAKEGFRVTVLEKNAVIGGGLQNFRRFGEFFDTGMHIIGGMQPNGNIRRICDYLGITSKVRVRAANFQCASRLYFADDKSMYEIPCGRNAFVEKLSEYFPNERDNIARYIDDVYNLTERELGLFYLRPSNSYISIHSNEFAMPANEFIAQYISDEKLRSVLSYMNPLYGGKKDCTPAYIHCIISVLYINGQSYFVGGSQHFANLLADVINSNGGQVIANNPVVSIDVEERYVRSVTTKNGNVYSADKYISAIHQCSLFPLLPEGALPKSYINRLNSIPNSYSAFSLYIKLKENSYPYSDTTEYYMSRYQDIWDFDEPDKTWPMGFLMMTPPELQQGEYARKILITAPMRFDAVSRWQDSTSGHRGEDYEKFKAVCASVLLDKVEELHPNIRQCIDKYATATPLTIRDFYNVKDGSMCGFSKDCRNLALTQVPVITKIKNLFLTGQNNNLHGFCGTPLTAINTAEAILGNNYIINKLN